MDPRRSQPALIILEQKLAASFGEEIAPLNGYVAERLKDSAV
jgi:hypothetical protein